MRPRNSLPLPGWLPSVSAPDAQFHVVSLLTILLLWFYSGHTWFMEAALVLLCIPALLHQPLLQKSTFWLLLFSALALSIYTYWYEADNHEYLILIWVLALASTRLSPNPAGALAGSARMMIGLCFLFATGWKCLSPSFMDGSFFHHLLLIDDRFFDIAEFIGGVGSDALFTNEDTFYEWIEFGDPAHPLSLASGPRVAMLASVLTWWTIAIEATIALLFLWMRDNKITRWRHAFLLLFVLTTYIPAPVVGFAWVLCIMGIAQSNVKASPLWPVLYVGAFILVETISYIDIRSILGLFI